MRRWLPEITWERALATGSNDIDEIYQRMAVIRRELHSNVRESVAGAEAFVDWGRYTWTYPWVALGATAAVGYVLYRGSHQKATTDVTTLDDGTEAGGPVAGVGAKGRERSKIGQKLLLTAWDIMFPVAVRAGQNYLLYWLEQQYPTRRLGRTELPPSAGKQDVWMVRQET
jgi:hypothetical protein